MNLLSTTDAAKIKGITKQALIFALDRGAIDGQRMGPRTLVIFDNKKFQKWEPNQRMVKAQKARWRKQKRKEK